MPTRRQYLWIFALGIAAISCSATPTDESWGNQPSPIIGGSVAAVCGWPTTIMVLPIRCTGTLVHPRVIVTAKHCLGRNPSSVGFGERHGQYAKTVAVSQCYRHPQNDFGFCVLAEDVVGMPIVPVMAPCEMGELKMGAAIVEAGFGDQSASGNAMSGTKKWIAGTIVRAGPTRTSVDVTTGTQDGEYFGDSGGPLYFKMPDGTWRLIGEDCCSADWNNSNTPRVSTYTSVPFHVTWAEQQSGIDLTPCHDASGWNPGAECGGFPTNPGEGVGTWANMCAGQTLLVSPTCGGVSDAARPDVRPPVDAANDVARDTTGTDARADAPVEASIGSSGDASGVEGDANSDARDSTGASTSSGPGAGGNAGSGAGGVGVGGMGGSGGGGGPRTGGTSSTGSADAESSAEAGCSCSMASRRSSAPAALVLALVCAAGARRSWRARWKRARGFLLTSS